MISNTTIAEEKMAFWGYRYKSDIPRNQQVFDL